MLTKHLGAGALTDVAFHQGRWWCVWHGGSDLHLVSLEPGTLAEQSWTSWAIGEPGAFPRLLSWVGRLWLAHREGAAPYRIVLREVGTSHVEFLDVGHGADPVALGTGDVAWQATGGPEWQVWRKPLVGTEPSRFVRQGRPTGLSRVLSDGAVKTVDEDREVLTGYTRPSWAGDLVVAEGRNLGAYAHLTDGRELVVWPGEEAVTPRCATDGGDRFGIATWGREGVRFAEVTRSEFATAQPTPVPVEDTSGQPVDLWGFFLPSPGVFPRTSDIAGHGHEMHCVFDGRNFWTLPFGELDHWVRMVVEGDTLTFREDRSRDNQNTGDYSFTHGLWARRQMRVGDRIVNAENSLVRYQPDGCRVVDVHAFPYRTGLWKHWTSFDCGGDLKWQDVIAYLYDPGGLQDTYELSYFAKGYGFFRWEEYDQKTNVLRHWTTFNEFGGRAPQPTNGCWQRAHLALSPSNWPPKPPKPPDPPNPPDPPEPDPKPEPVMSDVSLQTFNRSNYVVAEDGGGKEGEMAHGRPTGLARADRVAPGPWETFTFTRGADGRVGFRAPNGGWLSAQPDGTLVFNRHRPDDFVPEGWEGFRVEGAIEGGISLVTDHGTRVRAINAGGGEVRHDVRDVAGIDETFFPSVSLTGSGGSVGGGPVPPPVTGLDRIDGQLGLEPGGGFHINGRPVLPTLCHYGDALSKWMRDRDHVRRNLDLMTGAGYHGIRYWTVLDGEWWNGRHVGESFQPDYWDQHRAFLLELKARGLVAQISQGSLTRDAVPDRHRFANHLADVLIDVGPDVCALFEGVNEARDTGEADAIDVVAFVRVFHDRLPSVLCGLSAYTGTEDPVILNDWSQDPAQMFMVHPYRGGRNHDKTRHLMSLQYENGANARVMSGARLASADLARIATDIDASRRQTALETADWLQRHMPHRVEEITRLLAIGSGQIGRLSAAEAEATIRLLRRNGWNSEGPGIGNRVSAIDNRDEMTGATMCGLAAMSFMMRMAYVNFYGVGVISDDGGSQTFDQMPGFFDVPKVRALVPADVCRYSGPIFHGGETWRNERTFAAQGDVRADHVVHHDGRRVIGIYGPGDLNVPQERGFNADVDHVFGNEFRLVVGRAA